MYKKLSLLSLCFLLAGCDFFKRDQQFRRETIFDKIVNIETDIIKKIPYLPPLCDQLPGLKKGTVAIDDGMLYYEEEGQGMPLVLINGGPGGTHHGFHPYFSQIKDGVRIIYYDQRGTGKSSADATGKTYTIQQAVKDLDDLRKALKIDRLAVLGWSYGGFLAQCYALTYPEHISGLVLVASSAGLPNVKMKHSRERLFMSQDEQKAVGSIFSKLDKGEISLQQGLYNKALNGDWKRQGYYKPTQGEIIRSALYEWSPAPGFRNLIGPDEGKIDLQGLFDDFEVPTLIAEGVWDLTWDTDKAGLFHKNHPHAQLERFEKSGHAVFADEPEKFFKLLQNFLKEFATAKSVTMPKKRVPWPTKMSDLARAVGVAFGLPPKEKEKAFLNCYEQAVRDNNEEKMIWGGFIQYFIRSQSYYDKCLVALQKFEQLEKSYIDCIKTWQGHMLDLLGKREEAIKAYQEALAINKETLKDCFESDIVIDKAWLQERIKTPFTWPTKGAPSVGKIPEVVYRGQTKEEAFSFATLLIEKLPWFEQQGYDVPLPAHKDFEAVYKRPELLKEKESSLREIFYKEVYDASKFDSALKMMHTADEGVKKALQKLAVLKKKWGFKLRQGYNIILTLYGPGGNYGWEDDVGNIVIKIDPKQTKEWFLNRIVHETVHIGIEEDIVGKYNLQHWEKERLVDLICSLYLKDLLPDYENQEGADTKIDSFLSEKIIMQNLPEAIAAFVARYPRESTSI